MKNIFSPTLLLKAIGRAFRRYNLTIFIVFVIACLTAAVLMFNTILTEASQSDDYQPSVGTNSIDQVTLDRINALHTSDGEYPQPTQPTGRNNPFSE